MSDQILDFIGSEASSKWRIVRALRGDTIEEVDDTAEHRIQWPAAFTAEHRGDSTWSWSLESGFSSRAVERFTSALDTVLRDSLARSQLIATVYSLARSLEETKARFEAHLRESAANAVRYEERLELVERCLIADGYRLAGSVVTQQDVDWSDVRAAATASADALGWAAGVEVVEACNILRLNMPSDQASLVANSELEFYADLALRLPQATFRAISIQIEIGEESSADGDGESASA